MMFHWTAAALFCGTVALAALLTLLARISAHRFGVLDQPAEPHKKQNRAVPLLGGMAVCTTFIAVVGICLTLDGLQGQDDLQLAPVMVSLAIFCIVGLLDDLRPQRARTKLILQILAALPWALSGLPFDSLQLFGVTLSLGAATPVLAVLWILCSVNALNLIDGLDGLASLTGAAVLAGIAGIAIVHGDRVTFATASLLAASLAGFLIHNRPPAKIYLGDSGSMAVGFLLGALTLSANSTFGTSTVSILPPLVLMSVPGYDVLVAILRRLLTDHPVSVADWNHFHHRLLGKGYGPWRATLTISAFAGVTSCVAVTGVMAQNDLLLLSLCLCTLGAITLTVGFGRHELILLGRFVLRRATQRQSPAGESPENPPAILPLYDAESESDEDTDGTGRQAA